MLRLEDRDISKAGILRGMITAGVLVALFLLIKRLSGVLLPFLVSFVIAYLLSPIVDFLQHTCRLRNRLLSVIVTLVVVLGVLTAAVAALTPAIRSQAETLTISAQHYAESFDADRYLSPEMQQELMRMLSDMDWQTLAQDPDIRETARTLLSKVGGLVYSGLSALTGLAVVFVCLLYIIFLLIDFPKITQSWAHYVPQRYRASAELLMHDLDRNMNAYFRGQGLIALIVGILFAIGFQIIGLPMGIAMGLLIGVLNLVPYMQTLGIPPCIILGLIQTVESDRPIWLIMLLIALVFVVVQSIQDLVLTPRIMGNVTGMGPAAILLCLSIWGSLLGVIGMIIALPLTTLIISYYERLVLHLPEPAPAPKQPSLWERLRSWWDSRKK